MANARVLLISIALWGLVVAAAHLLVSAARAQIAAPIGAKITTVEEIGATVTLGGPPISRAVHREMVVEAEYDLTFGGRAVPRERETYTYEDNKKVLGKLGSDSSGRQFFLKPGEIHYAACASCRSASDNTHRFFERYAALGKRGRVYVVQLDPVAVDGKNKAANGLWVQEADLTKGTVQ